MNLSLATSLPWIQALGWTLLHFVWQASAVGIVFAAVRALIPTAYCNARYTAGVAALAVLAICPLATFLILHSSAVTDLAFATESATAVDASMVLTAADSAPDVAQTIASAMPWLVLAWIAGVLLMAGRALQQWHALATIAKRWAESSAELDLVLDSLARRFGFVRRMRVLISDRIDTPMLIGWLKPIVLLPTAVALGFPRQQIELILAHELGHLRRYDHLVNLGQALLETLLFYHPVVHWISRDVRNERELCCDALVLRVADGEPRDYARTLASLEELRQNTVSFALAASGGQLAERVRRIVGISSSRTLADPGIPGRWLSIMAVAGLALATVLRIEHADDATWIASKVSIGWSLQPDLRVLPLATLALPFKQPQLRVVAMPRLETPSVKPATPPAAGEAPLNRDRVLESAEPAVPAAPALKPALLPTATAPTAERVMATAPKIATTTPVAPAPALPPAAAKPASPDPANDPIQKASRPVAIHTVTPAFPTASSSVGGRVEASFLIAADGSVHDIKITDGGAPSAFQRAAERALRDWRFDPSSVPSDRSERYTQTFVFAAFQPGSSTGVNECIQSTGSLICRDLSDGTRARVSRSRQ